MAEKLPIGTPGRIIGRRLESSVAVGSYRTEPFASPSVETYLESGNVHREWTHVHNRLAEYGDSDRKKGLVLGLPTATHRPLLTAALLTELTSLDTAQSGSSTGQLPFHEVIAHSRIASVHRLPYTALHLPDVLEEMGGVNSVDIDTIYNYFCSTTPKDFEDEVTKPINSTLRNALLARELNRTILRDSKYKARLATTEYTWQDRLSTVHNQDAPELPWGYESQKLAKFVIVLVEEEVGQNSVSPANGITYFDYGESEGDVSRVTGEALNITPLWSMPLIDPEDSEQLRKGLDYLARRQYGRDGAIGKVGTELINQSRALVDTVEMLALTDPLPPILSQVEDLSEHQINDVTHVSQMIMDMWKIYSNTNILQYQRVIPWRDWMTALVQMKQPSTRTVLAAMTAIRAVGMIPIELDQSASSQAKGEAPASENITFVAQNIGAVLSRDPDFENRAAILAENATEQDPIRISLGGNRHHPSQTLAELQTLMEEYGCSTLFELRKKTTDNPPIIMFMGHTENKRADKTSIEFIAKHLPKWKIKVLVPAEKYKPTDLDLHPAQYETIVNGDITDETVVADLTRDVDLVYISNAEGTAQGAGKGDGLVTPDYSLTANVVEQNGLRVMAPLPASEELDPKILNDSRFNHLIQRTIEYKNSVLAASLLLMIASQEFRNRDFRNYRIPR